jgi:hypothetical protein
MTELDQYTADQMRAYAAQEVAAERERWAEQVRAMHEADDAYGAGFYNSPKWRRHYEELRRMCGMGND